MRIALVYPAIAGWGFNCYKANVETSWVSHGLAMLSACAKAAGHTVDLVDLRRLKGWKHYGQTLRELRPGLVGVHMCTVDFNPALKSVEVAKQVLPEAIVAVGGPHPSLAPEQLEGRPGLDHVFVGEGEISFPGFLREVGQGGQRPPRLIVGEKPDLDAVPFMDRSLFGPYELPPPKNLLPEPFLSIISSRGCMFRCKFCQPAESKIFGKKVRRRSVDNMIEELRVLKRTYGIRGFIIHDDCLMEDRKWVTGFCEAFRREGFDMKFMCQTRADLICKNQELFREMVATGLEVVIIGFESGSQRVLDFLGKGTTVEQNLESARICRREGVKIWGNYMMGMPTETKEEVVQTVNMMREIRPDVYAPTFFTPHVGSYLHDYSIEHGLWSPTSFDDYRRNATAPKIKGVDYNFLFNALELSRHTPRRERWAKWVVRKTLGMDHVMSTYRFLGKLARSMHLKGE